VFSRRRSLAVNWFHGTTSSRDRC